ncbi:methyl-accepting chemotaxis protein [Silvibacterium dinghuense]|uniref:HAMP domain-containing protein n=1 Tax=Silvibacterium dinghuense TaxID=1560006 RepID=A0A4Q1SBA4_9BACT|nr:methyl-accepting chemotaxis protein [Silvibacterium dinghuense]RXS94411.1 HAMP domain-containing protein [Silvibacterium dinghuense]GGH16287.1 methyl-accepting chemotaxis protein II [Silvibacterium dinghuense]
MQWFRNLRAFPKLMLSFGLVIVLNAMTGMLALSRLSDANQRVSIAYTRDLDAISQVDNVTAAKLGMARLTRDALIFIKDRKRVADDARAFDELATQTSQSLAKLDADFRGEDGSAQIAEMARLLPGYVELCRLVLTRAQAGDQAGGTAALDAVQGVAKTLNADSAAASRAKQQRAQRVAAESEATYRNTRDVLWTAIVLCMLTGVGLSVWIGRLFSVPLGRTVELLKEVARGDLTQSLAAESQDETGAMARELNAALQSLRATLTSVADAASGLNTASRELAASADAIASGAQTQAASLEETSASLEEITATVRQTADQAREANQLSATSGGTAESGQKVVQEAVAAMNEIHAASAKIASIIASIDEISFQTNLLAVNAAVEAARAGEQGRGFAVVATEVRSLAVRSADAAKEIRRLIGDTVHKVERGAELVNGSGETLQQIVTSVKRVCGIVSEMSVACSEQSVGVEQVSTAMTQMDQVMQANSSQTEELAATAATLSDHSSSLLELVSRFRIDADAPPRLSMPARSGPERSGALHLRPSLG